MSYRCCRGERLPKYLPQYEVPRDLKESVTSSHWKLNQLAEELSSANYVSKMSTLLYVEEIEAQAAIRRFDMSAATFGRSREYLTLDVPGLPDGQPNLMVSDKISAKVNSHMQDLSYQGFIHDIRGDTIYVKFHSSFHDSYDDEECYIIFHINRATYRRMHNAVELVQRKNWPGLFPRTVSIQPSRVAFAESIDVSDDSWLVNKKLNREQRLAVKRVLQAKCRSLPYIVFGPPGTGKTMTVVESIVQTFIHVRGSRILVCTPSNSAADLLSLPEEIRPICQDGVDLSMVVQHKVVVCTCSSAGMMLTLGLSTDHFSHVYVDEAGQASEPECLIPIALVAANSQATVVLAGDHKQLGPVITSQVAKDYGLAFSLLERCMSQQPYSRHELDFKTTGYYDPNMVTKLLRNYRSHPFILSLYSQLFYDDELVASAAEQAFSLENINELRTQGKPIIFHGMQGVEMREMDNPSWFNNEEVVQVLKYVALALRYNPPEDVGVITPYRKQVEKVRQLMETMGVSKQLKVGSVEEFQGQERKVVVVSTVRSSADDTAGSTGNLSLGFVANRKRFNVAISRAQALLIVIGNPLVLAQDAYWRDLIEFCLHHRCYIGMPYTAQEQ